MAKNKAESVASPKWTASQAAAIEHVEGDLLVSAAAGSGKTAVLAQRCVRLVTMAPPAGTTIDRLLVVTFTEAAATEMRLRIAQELRKKIDAVGEEAAGPELLRQAAMVDRAAISTLHGFCMRTLRAYFHEAGMGGDVEGGVALDPSFEILDADEGRLMQEEVLEGIFRRHHVEDVRLEKEGKRSGFAGLLESHAQGAEGRLKGFILNLHRMLVTLRDPAAWLVAAQDQYTVEGSREILAAYARHVAGDLRMEARRCADGLARLKPLAGVEGLREPMQRFKGMLEEAARDLEEDGMGAWERVRELLQGFEWDRIATNKAVSDFGMLKDQTVEKAREALKGLLGAEFSEGQTAMEMRGNLMNAEPAVRALIALTREFDQAFTKAKRAQNRLDFSDLERLTLQMLTREGSPAAADLQQRFDHVLVDEFQDINPLQAALLEAVASKETFGGKGNLFAVGDVKQSIYGFRLADPEEFLHLEEKLRGVKTHRAFVALQHNFRTAPRLLNGLNALFAKLITRDVAGVDYTQEHQLVAPPEADAKDGAAMELYVVVPEADENGEEEDDETPWDEKVAARIQLSPMELEARFVARKIEELIAARTPVKLKDGTTRAMGYRDIAILLRSVKERALLFSRALAERNIPVHADLATGYFDAQEVRDALALLAVLDNPYQDIPLGTLLLSPVGRFSHDDLARIRLAYPKRGEQPFHEIVHRFMLEALGPDAELAEKLRAFFARLDGYRRRARVLPLHDALAEMYDDSGLLTYVAGLPGGVQRIANLQALHHQARQFSGFRKQGLYRFLRFIERLKESASDFGEAPVLSEASDVVRIMSIHKSKGLEFPVVFASTLGARFNLGRTEPVMVDRDHKLALAAADEAKNIFVPTPLTAMALARSHRLTRAEELRLLYVALTRARERLILTGAAKAGAWENAQKTWAKQPGPLPAYLLLNAQSFFDVLLPAAAGMITANREVCHPVVVEMSGPPAEKIVRADAAAGATNLERVAAERRGKAPDAGVAGLIRRLEYEYPQMPLARMQALFTVTELKKLALREAAAFDEEQAAEMVATPPAGFKEILETGPVRRSAGATRGVATHRLLELLDFARVDTAAGLRDFIAEMVDGRRLSEEEGAAIDVASVLWFLETPQGRRLCEIARGTGGAVQMLREVPFVVALEASEIPDAAARACLAAMGMDRKDRPQLRGVIDVLLAGDKEAELLDYKTDSAFTIGASLGMYEQQMRYYARAVEACLGLKVKRASLVLLATRKVHEVHLSETRPSETRP